MTAKEVREIAKAILSKYDSNIYYHYSELTEDSFIDGFVEGYMMCEKNNKKR